MSRILITSALPYINGIKHLGNLAGSMLPADVYARFQRARGRETLYICATDEHGTPAELAAAAAGQGVYSYCEAQHRIQHDIGRRFGLSWDWFGRSSSPQNHALTQHFADVLEDRGLIEERTDRMVYSPTDGRFLPDRYVEGTCPVCGWRPARGDQCDNCGSLLDPTELIEPYSAVSGATDIEVRETRHLYLLQSKLQDRIRAWVEARTEWPALTRSIALKHLDEGLPDRGVTRDLSWGVPVTRRGLPRPGFETKVFYVWFDAPFEYVAATREMTDAEGGGEGGDWERWWRTDKGADDVRYVQFMGKDNVAFHATGFFPASVIGSEEPWKQVDVLKSFNWLNWYGGKFSTSQGRGVFMDAALEIQPADCWRWYLTANAPEGSDTAFTWEQFASAVNRDLADVLGNFVNRILKFCETRFDGVVPEGGELTWEMRNRLQMSLAEPFDSLTANLEALEFRKAAQALRGMWVVGNEFLQDAAPWTVIKTDRKQAAAIVRTGLNLVDLYSRVSAPILPSASETMSLSVGESYPSVWPEPLPRPFGAPWAELSRLPPGRKVAAPEVLFRKIDEAQIAAWTDRFGGAEG